jgi:predicted AlkP superfamily pyrophosphatase or phosphodiesterase
VILKPAVTTLLQWCRGLALVLALALSQGGISGDTNRPAVLLVSLDGFRWDFLEKTATPNLRRFVAGGVRAKALIPVFPSETFPSHYSMATGLHPARHGIVGNKMHDPAIARDFNLSEDRPSTLDPKWWQGEPIWITARKQDLISATCFWPGTDVQISGMQANYWLPFDGAMPDEQRIAQVIEWLSLPDEKQPQLITLYFGGVDTAGHRYGPDSPQVVEAIGAVDRSIGLLMERVEKIGRMDVNVVIVSDHGMTSIGEAKTLLLENYINLEDATVSHQGALPSLIPRPGKEVVLLEQLKHVPHVKFYRRDETPERLHFRNSPRIAPIVGLADEGWLIFTKENGEAFKRKGLRGAHGFDNGFESMHGFFAAKGPAFRTGVIVEAFQNVHIYELVTHLLKVKPAPNDGDFKVSRPLLIE